MCHGPCVQPLNLHRQGCGDAPVIHVHLVGGSIQARLQALGRVRVAGMYHGPVFKTLNLHRQGCGDAPVIGVHLLGGSIQARLQCRAGCA